MQVNRAAVARSAMWSVLENGGLALISFSALIIYSRFLSVSDFGLFSIVLAVVELMTLLVGMLFHDALVQRQDITELHYDTAFTAALGLSALLMAACWLIAPMFAARAGNPQAAPVLLWTSLCLPLTAVSSTIVARQRRNLAFRALAIRSIVGRSLGAVVGIVLVVYGAAFWGLVAQQILIVLFGSLVLWITCDERPRLRFGWREFRELIAFGTLAVATLFVNFAMKRTFIILSGIGLGTHAAGLLNLSFRAIDTFWSLASTAISQIALPVLASLRKDDERFARAFHSASAFACAVLYFCFLLIGATSPEVVALLFGPQWLSIAPYVTVLAMLVVIQARRLLMAPMMTALGRPRDLLVCQVVELVFILSAVWWSGVPSLDWAIGIWIVRECLGAGTLLWLFRRATGFGPRLLFGSSVIPLLAAAAMFAAVWASRMTPLAQWNSLARLAVLAPLGAIVYFGCVALLDRRLIVDLIGFARAALQRRRQQGDNTSAAAPETTP
ncbi:MAG TPA: oligosaccharide flippase family protein [Burkholderiaceae bacterium]|nr:oligosaccharide flippase family protein [Burkholderiaceae bacterium]